MAVLEQHGRKVGIVFHGFSVQLFAQIRADIQQHVESAFGHSSGHETVLCEQEKQQCTAACEAGGHIHHAVLRSAQSGERSILGDAVGVAGCMALQSNHCLDHIAGT